MSRLYNILNALVSPTTMAFTRTNNSYVSATDFGRIGGIKLGKIGWVYFNLYLSAAIPANTTSVKIGSINDTSLASGLNMTVSPQSAGNQAMLVTIDTSGNISIGNGTGSSMPSGWYRAVIPVILGGVLNGLISTLSAISSFVRRWRHEQVVQHSEHRHHESPQSGIGFWYTDGVWELLQISEDRQVGLCLRRVSEWYLTTCRGIQRFNHLAKRIQTKFRALLQRECDGRYATNLRGYRHKWIDTAILHRCNRILGVCNSISDSVAHPERGCC